MFCVGEKVKTLVDIWGVPAIPKGSVGFIVAAMSPYYQVKFTSEDGRESIFYLNQSEMSRCNDKSGKDDTGKPDIAFLLSLNGLDSVSDVFAFGAKKYGDPYNFRKPHGDGYSLRLLGASVRHIWKYLRGERLDPETGKSHIAHAVADLLMVLDLEAK